MKKRSMAVWLTIAVMGVAGCGKGQADVVKLDAKNPVSITVWHYYNGAQKTSFDELVTEFNNTVGREKGIYVEGHSQGDVNTLEENVLAAVEKQVGSANVPNIFSTYADTAYAVDQMGCLADISVYMSEEELSEYVDSYIEEGKIGSDGELRIFPVAKSSEIFMLNKTDWDTFAKATGTELSLLETKEGIVEAARRYYEWTDALTPDINGDGKAFYGRDAIANLFIIGSMELGTEIFEVNEQKVTLNVDREVMRKIWDIYYVPYVKGYFGAYGRFRSDDVKIGKLLAYTGSTASSMYFPEQVELESESYPIEYMILPPPLFAEGESYGVQQGAGMVISKATPEEEYASVLFLQWFTQAENNLLFGCSSGYLPVRKEAGSKERLDRVIEENQLDVMGKTYDTLVMTLDRMQDTVLYTNKAFAGGSSARKVLEYHMADQAAADRGIVEERLAEGAALEDAAAEFLTDEAFDAWYEDFCKALEDAVSTGR